MRVALFLVSLSLCAPEALGQATIRSISLRSNDIVYEPVGGYLYVSVPTSVGGALGNSITRINPNSATIVNSIFAWNNPTKLAVSDNGQYLYAGLNDYPGYRRFNLATQTASSVYAIGSDPFYGAFHVADIEPMPGSPGTVAISRYVPNLSPSFQGVAIFDNGTRRPVTTGTERDALAIEFGPSPNTIFGFNQETSGFEFTTMTVLSGGVTFTAAHGGLMTDFYQDFVFDGQRCVSTGGRAFDPISSTIIGTYNGGFGSVASDPANNRVFFANFNGIQVFDRQTFSLITTIPVPGASPYGALVRWGPNGLAFRDYNQDRIYLINSDLIPSPGAAALLGLGLLAAPRRRRA